MNKLMKQMSYGLTIDEIADETIVIECGGTFKFYYCSDCDVVKTKTDCGGYACRVCCDIECGYTQSYSDMRLLTRPKSVHKRSWWMGRKLRNLVKPEHIELIKEDFMEVVNALYSCNLIKGKNVSRYGYYIY